MGKRSLQHKNVAATLDISDTDSLSSTSTLRSDQMLVSGVFDLQLEKDSVLDQASDDLYEKRASTREKALVLIIDAFNSKLQHEFVEKKFATLLHQCLNSIKKGSAKEIALASHTIGLLALTTGPGEKAQEILEESFSPILEALKSKSDSTKILALLECLAIITFIGGDDPEDTEKSMQTMWQVVHPKLGSNVVAIKPSPAVITSGISAWSFLLTTTDGWTLNPKAWQESISYFSTLLDKDDRLIRIAAGEALALIFEMGNLEKLSVATTGSSDSSNHNRIYARELTHIQGLRARILNQVRSLSVEAGGKGSAKKGLNSQRNTFHNILEYLENGNSPETLMKIGGESVNTTTWSQLIQLNFLKHFLAGGFVKQMQDNEVLHDIFGFSPKRKLFYGTEKRLSGTEKRMYMSPNSVLNKSRTRFLNKQRMLSQDRNAGHFAAAGMADDV
ncbi:Interferon-related developmental regulator 1 [Heracleum sosnowskyi]|uniref:Interferon-related developmental regulator 1 n=1 Tax=Heracleum sosnowskyi TaxID=360622 RepID=A0AAD8N1P4_9APIA|nr:Interferon-related developmental regulator 1 [Heracleum sosnowskyi]